MPHEPEGSEAPRARPAASGRLSWGNAELDQMLNGGLFANRPYLIVGPSGTGKTTLALQFLCEGVRRGEEVLIVTLEEPPNEMRFNHRSLQPELDRVWVFDAIPDVMRYERAPFKDVAQVRDAVRFSDISPEIRKTPELTSVEITLTALEQTLKMQRARRHYTRIVIDSLTALQYFCMKGIDEVQGAQSFVRFLSGLGATAVLTIESALEEFESPERLLARGELRLFRWDLEGRTVRALGVEKFRGSAHDNRLHPYRIGGRGLDIRLDQTISRDTRIVLRPAVQEKLDEHVEPIVVSVVAEPVEPTVDTVGEILAGISAEIEELQSARLDLATIRGTLESARQSLVAGEAAPAQAALAETRALVHQMTLGHRSARSATAAPTHRSGPPRHLPEQPLPRAALDRMVDHLSGALATIPAATAPSPPETPAEPPPPHFAIEPTPAPPLVPEAPAARVPASLEPPSAPPISEGSATAPNRGDGPDTGRASGADRTGPPIIESLPLEVEIPPEPRESVPFVDPGETTKAPPAARPPEPSAPGVAFGPTFESLEVRPAAVPVAADTPGTVVPSPEEASPAEAEAEAPASAEPGPVPAPVPIAGSTPSTEGTPTAPAGVAVSAPPPSAGPALSTTPPVLASAAPTTTPEGGVPTAPTPKRRRRSSTPSSTSRRKGAAAPAAGTASVASPPAFLPDTARGAGAPTVDNSPGAELLASISVELTPPPKPKRKSTRRRKAAAPEDPVAAPSTSESSVPATASAAAPVAPPEGPT